MENDILKLAFMEHPYPCCVFDSNFEVITWSHSMTAFLGCNTLEKVKKELSDFFVKSVLSKHFREKELTRDKLFAMLSVKKQIEFKLEVLVKEETIPTNIVIKTMDSDEKIIFLFYIHDLRKNIEFQKDMERKDELLDAVNNVAFLMLKSTPENFEDDIWESFDILGRVSKANRVYIWENSIGEDNRLYCTQTYEWVLGAEVVQGVPDIAINISYADLFTWENILSSGKFVNSIVADLPEPERVHLEKQSVLSILAAPIFIEGNFWGFIGFDDCERQRLFTPVEEDLLSIGGSFIVSSIMRNRTTKSLLEAREAAVSSMEAKTVFLSRMSHEIRTPLNAVIGMTQIALNTDSLEKKDECLSKIKTSSNHLLSLINDILDMSKIEANKLEIYKQEFSLKKLLTQLYNMISVQSNEMEQNLIVTTAPNLPLYFVGDFMRLTQVLTNLLNNAVKFTPKGGSISLAVEIEAVEEKNYFIRFIVTDTGIGMDESRISQLFIPFEQSASSITSKYGGTGLGLAISKNIIDLMGGQIIVESKVDAGSKFSVMIPMEAVSEEQLLMNDSDYENESDEKFDFSNNIILLAEDIPINREIVRTILQDTGITIEYAENGLDAVKQFQENPNRYDLILMDIQMPEMDGYTATKTIRGLDIQRAQTIPILAMTANAFKEDIEKCLASGMNGHIAKPIDLNILLEVLSVHLQVG